MDSPRMEFSRWAVENGVIECCTVGEIIRFLCHDGTRGSFDTKSRHFTFKSSLPVNPDKCEFCGEPSTKTEYFDRDVFVCDSCSG